MFATVTGVKESILDMVMNMKLVRFTTPQEEGVFKMSLIAKGAGKIYAKDFEGEAVVVNGDRYHSEKSRQKKQSSI